MKVLKFGLQGVENIVGKGEQAGYQHFLLFPQCFQKTSFPRSLKDVVVWKVKRYWIEIGDKAAESVEQDQIARLCSPISFRSRNW